MHRIFLVGCPRSGTTIIQALLVTHSEIVSFPETKIFHYAFWDKFINKLPERLSQFFNNEINRPELIQGFNKNQSMSTNVRWFLDILDALAREQQKSIWLEKTPEHIFFIKEISFFLPNAKFIHVTRNGLDTIASLYEATRMSQNELWGGQWSLDYCIKRWKTCNSITKLYYNNPQHFIVKYEDLLVDKILVLKACCDFIEVAYDNTMTKNYKSEALKLGLNMPWHDRIDREIKPPVAPKYNQVFRQSEIDYILDKLKTC